jgi:hypothetical protein
MKHAIWVVVLLAACGQTVRRTDAGNDSGREEDAGRDAGRVIEEDAGPMGDAGPIATLGGRLVLSEVEGIVELTPGVPLEVRVLGAVVAFSSSASASAPDFSGTGCPLCCTASHFDVATDPPLPSEDAGEVTITGYSGGTFADGSTAPSTISCTLEGTEYACRYADGRGTGEIAFAASTSDPLRASDLVTFDVGGAGGFGALSRSLMPADAVDATTDLTTLAFDPTADLVISYACAGGVCGPSPIVVSMTATQGDVESPTSFGSITCAVLGGTAATIPRGAIAAMLGCDATGAGCDTSLTEVRTVVLRTGLPMSATDTNGNTITPIVSGQGVFGTSTL